jgi:hypothetical protein
LSFISIRIILYWKTEQSYLLFLVFIIISLKKWINTFKKYFYFLFYLFSVLLYNDNKYV